MHTCLRILTAMGVLGAAVPLVRPAAASNTGRADVKNAIGELPDDTVQVALSEWKIELARDRVAPGMVVFRVRNKGTMPHAFEIEGGGIERELPPIRPGADTLIALGVREGKYEIYCPIGENTAHAHKAMGMLSALSVGSPSAGSSSQFQER